MCAINDVKRWNSIIVSTPPYKDILERTSINVTSSYLFLFQQEKVTTIDEALEKLISFVNIDKVIPEGIDGIVDIINNVSASKAGIIIRKMRARTNELTHGSGKLGLLDAAFRFKLEAEEPSDQPKTYYNPYLRINVNHSNGFRYVSHVLRIVCHSAVHFFGYILTKYGYDFNNEETLISLINSKDAIDLTTIKAITYKQLEEASFGNASLSVCATNSNLLERSLPYINSKRGKPTGTRRAIPKAIKTALWDIYHPGKLKGKCYCCKNEIDARSFEAGHIIPHCQDGPDTVDNLVPICRVCNNSMGSMHLNEYMARYHSSIETPKSSEDDTSESFGSLDDKSGVLDKVFENRENHVDQFLSTLHIDPLCRVKSKDLKDAYKNWCSNLGYKQMPIKEFDKVVVSKYSKVRDICVYYLGVGLKEPPGVGNEYNSLVEGLNKLKDTSTLLRDLQRKGVSRGDLEKLKNEKLPSIILDELRKL